MRKIKIFVSQDIWQVQKSVNEWLEKNNDKVIISIHFQTQDLTDANDSSSTVLIFYSE